MNQHKTTLHTDLQEEIGNPFPGLRSFKIDESHLFFGREGQSEEVLLKLSQNRFVGIVGPSGSGKSSFLYCGILPILYGGFLSNISSEWEVITTRPGTEPIDNLAIAIENLRIDQSNAEDQSIKQNITSALLRSSSLGLVEAIQQLKQSNANHLILVDQFEELFWIKKSVEKTNETLSFINLLIEAINYEDANIYVAITMRSDFIGHCSQFPSLTHKLNQSHYLIPQMTREQKRKSIEGPMAISGTNITHSLIQQLLANLGDNADQLPILQHAMMRTWTYWKKHRAATDEPIDIKHYEAVGGMEQALSLHANEAYDELTEKQKYICEIIFKTITESRGENFGVRRPSPIKEIAAIARVPIKEVITVVDKFREQGRSLLLPVHTTTLNEHSIIDISHESLMRIWTRLKKWVEDEFNAAQMYLRLSEAANMYQVGKAGLWKSPDLQIALNWKNKYKPTLLWGQRYHPAFERTMVFLDSSLKEEEAEKRIQELTQKKKLRQAKVTAIIFGSMMVIALMFLVYAIYQQTEAKKQQEKAIANANEAKEKREEAEEAQKQVAKERDIAVKAEQNAQKAQKRAEINYSLAEKRRKYAERLRKRSDENATRARISEEKAKKNELEAKLQQERARQSAEHALQARYVAQAKAMALKSQEFSDNPEREALLAQQAYIFNTKNQGYKLDNDIYNGLFRALKNYNHPTTRSLAEHKKGSARAIVAHAGLGNVYSGGSEGKIVQWNYVNGEWVSQKIADERTNFLVFALDVSPDGKYLAAAGLNAESRSNNYVELYDLENLKEDPEKIEGYTADVTSLIFTPNSEGFYTKDNGGYSIRYCEIANTTVEEIIHSQIKINDLSLSPSGKILAGAGADGQIHLWNVENNYSHEQIAISDNSLSAISFRIGDNELVVGDLAGVIHIIVDKKMTKELFGHTGKVERIRFNKDRNIMVSSSNDFSVRMWNYNDLKKQPIVLTNQDWVWDVTFSPKGDQIITCINSTTETIDNIEYPIRIWASKPQQMSSLICDMISRNMTKEEWDTFVGEDLPYEKTCQNITLNNE